jgi:hypothetical protein
MRPIKLRIPIDRVTWLTAVTLLLIVMPLLGSTCCRASGEAWAAESKKGVYTPAAGSAVQKAILTALGKKLASTTHLKMVFTVQYLKVHGCWAWIHVLPKSPDGTQQYEDVNALMEKKAGCWQVAEIACTEEGNPNCLGAPDFFTKLKARFPGVPADIFPDGVK